MTRFCFSAEANPWLALSAERLAAMTDRLMVPLTPSGETPPGIGDDSSHSFLLTAKAAPGARLLVARTEGELSAPVRLMKTMVHWYQSHVVKREKGDQLEIEPTVYLYRPQ